MNIHLVEPNVKEQRSPTGISLFLEVRLHFYTDLRIIVIYLQQYCNFSIDTLTCHERRRNGNPLAHRLPVVLSLAKKGILLV